MDEPPKNTNHIGSCLFLKGNLITRRQGNDKGVSIRGGFQNIKFDPHAEYLHISKEAADVDAFHISMEEKGFFQFLADNEKWAEELRSSIVKRNAITGENNAAITSGQFNAINIILNCPLKGKLGEMMVETAVTQILLLQLNELFRDKVSENNPRVAGQDLKIVSQTKELPE